MELNTIKQLLLTKKWTDNTMGITYRFVNDKELIINGVSGYTYQLKINKNSIILSINPETSPDIFDIEIIDGENLKLSDNKKIFILTAN